MRLLPRSLFGRVALVLLGTLPQSAAWLRAHDEVGVVLFVLLFAVTGGLALLPTYTPSLLGGWAFGIRLGLAATLLGFLGAATIGFFAATVAGVVQSGLDTVPVPLAGETDGS